MKHLLALLFLVTSAASAVTVVDDLGNQVNAVSYEIVMQPVVYTETPAWANLPGLEHYTEFLIARVFGDDAYIYNYTFRVIIARLAPQPARFEQWTELVRIGTYTDPNAPAPDVDTAVMLITGLGVLAISRRLRPRSRVVYDGAARQIPSCS